MDIDLNLLDDLFKQPQNNKTESCNSSALIEGEKTVEVDTSTLNDIRLKEKGDTPKKYSKLDRNREIQEKSLEMYGEYQKNIKLSERIRAKILKGIKAGEDKETLLLEAIKCISLMTSDKVFYIQAEKDLNKYKDIEQG